MQNITKINKELKKNFTPKKQDPSRPVRFWSEKDVLNKKIVNAFVIIFRTRGCSWAEKNGCTMCGYFNDSMFQKIDEKDLLKQYQRSIDNYNDEEIVKIFTSGSFLDEKEIPKKVRKHVLKDLSSRCKKINVETRPEYIKNDVLSDIKKDISDTTIELGIGLETADDHIRRKTINKGFNFKDYQKACEKNIKHGFQTKTYLLVKPPLLSEKKSIDDSIKSVEKVKDFSNTISFNPVNIQKNTAVEYLWKKNKYRPPWLYSIIEILKHSKKIAGDIRLQCDIAGGGKNRGAHNCRDCNSYFLEIISKFSLTQDLKDLKYKDCICKEKWLDQLDIEDLSFGSIIDIK